MNLMSVDTQRMNDFLLMVNFLWVAPLQVGIALVLLWNQLGIATLAGIAFMVVIMPINGYTARIIERFQQRIMKLKDKRVKLMNEILNGIKVFKLYAWEKSFIDKVIKLRQKEVNLLKQIAYMSGIMTFSFTSLPFFVSKTQYN